MNPLFSKDERLMKTGHKTNPDVQNASSNFINNAHLNNDSRREVVNPDYVPVDDQQITVTNVDERDSHPFAESYLTLISSKNEPAIVDNPAYHVKHGPPLSDNPAYIAIRDEASTT